ncbi:unnamed protein product [Brassica oleracea]|uniref:(rape) hypothetical protein n=1 Tax=Brassica napus TaxID=3708 RepID=A0A816J5J7_BRANA|nr:unnamed protein product [Brassica napus]
MAFATKSVSSFAIIFILVLVIFEVPEIESHDDECLIEYGGDVGLSFCLPEIFPSFCYSRCRKDKGALGGTCIWGEDGTVDVKCLCDYCSDIPNDKILSGAEAPEIEAQDSECLKEYGGNVGFGFCAPQTFPTICYIRCREDKDAKGGRCITGDAGAFDFKCLCDYCSDKPNDQILHGVI